MNCGLWSTSEMFPFPPVYLYRIYLTPVHYPWGVASPWLFSSQWFLPCWFYWWRHVHLCTAMRTVDNRSFTFHYFPVFPIVGIIFTIEWSHSHYLYGQHFRTWIKRYVHFTLPWACLMSYYHYRWSRARCNHLDTPNICRGSWTLCLTATSLLMQYCLVSLFSLYFHLSQPKNLLHPYAQLSIKFWVKWRMHAIMTSNLATSCASTAFQDRRYPSLL